MPIPDLQKTWLNNFGEGGHLYYLLVLPGDSTIDPAMRTTNLEELN